MIIERQHERNVFWQSLEEPGLEHLWLCEDAGEVIADGLIVGLIEGQPLRVQYEVRCNEQYQFQYLLARITQPYQGELILSRSSNGHWTDGEGNALPYLNGCIDIDLTVTPFTNTLPIRRLQFQVDQTEEIAVAYIEFPALTVTHERQRYTLVNVMDGHAVYRFEHLANGFTADIVVDSDGVVVDYPGLFRRV